MDNCHTFSSHIVIQLYKTLAMLLRSQYSILALLLLCSASYANASTYVAGQAGAFNLSEWKDLKATAQIALGHQSGSTPALGDAIDPSWCLPTGLGLGINYQDYSRLKVSATSYYSSSAFIRKYVYHKKSLNSFFAFEYAPVKPLTLFAKLGPCTFIQKISGFQKSYSCLSEYPGISATRALSGTNVTSKGIAGIGFNLTKRLNTSLAVVHDIAANRLYGASAVMAGFKYTYSSRF